MPPSQPRTKPKALNFGLLRARGELITIYDAEDRPEPLQLRRAVVAFSRAVPRRRMPPGEARVPQPPSEPAHLVVCDRVPVLVRILHCRRSPAATPRCRWAAPPCTCAARCWSEIGGWDPFNVTEDCDLGVRSVPHGVSDRVPQFDDVRGSQQRSHQLDQAALALVQGLRADLAGAHASSAPSLARARWPRGFCGFNMLVGATTLTALLNPVFWALTLTWFFAHPTVHPEHLPVLGLLPGAGLDDRRQFPRSVR